uniref:Immunoglobulin V-set domain-containing protein n=1 Tax=Mola mola TaxID=94237 RepID=A0A3Q4BC59_MOLML
ITKCLVRLVLNHIKTYLPPSFEPSPDCCFPTGVLQVTWQRLFKDGSIENLATHGKRFGQQVNEPFQGKVVLNDASLNSTSITVKNVTWNDEGCYICSFNAYPDGSKRKHTCLTVQGNFSTRVPKTQP